MESHGTPEAPTLDSPGSFLPGLPPSARFDKTKAVLHAWEKMLETISPYLTLKQLAKSVKASFHVRREPIAMSIQVMSKRACYHVFKCNGNLGLSVPACLDVSVCLCLCVSLARLDVFSMPWVEVGPRAMWRALKISASGPKER